VRAELLAVGSELVGPLRVDTNTVWITERLLASGIEVVARTTIADEQRALEGAFRASLARAEAVVATGGLGPTADDLTREAAAAATGRALRRDPALLEGLRQRFARHHWKVSAANERQADLIEGAVSLPNAHGSAPGQCLEIDGRLLVLLPGPPGEMKPMFDEQVLPRLRRLAGDTSVVRRRVLRIAAMAESAVDEIAAPVYSRFGGVKTTILGSPGQVELHLVAQAEDDVAAEARIETLAAELRAVLPDRILSEDGRELPQVVVELLRERGLTLALAESCTGGLLSARLTDVPGVSAVLERAFVTYSNRAKTEELGVDPGLVARAGAVSEEVAAAMAAGARAAAKTDVAVSITGIAGPDGGTSEKPVGLVYVALSGAGGETVRRHLFPGDRERVRLQATQVALEMLRRGLLGLPAL
jgi:nicotinamide-nucleotide amidase